MSLLSTQPPSIQPALRTSPLYHPNMHQLTTDLLYNPSASASAPFAFVGRTEAAKPPPPPSASVNMAELVAAAAAAAAAREEESLRHARALVLATAADVAAGGGRAAVEAILTATLGPDGRLRLPPAFSAAGAMGSGPPPASGV
jgi:hypothetical protein